MSIKNKLVGTILIIFTVIIGAMSWFSYTSTKNAIFDSVLTEQALKVKEISVLLDKSFHVAKTITDTFAKKIQSIDIKNGELITDYLKLAGKAGEIFNIYVGYEANDQFYDSFGWIPYDGYDPRKQPWYDKTNSINQLSMLGPNEYKSNEGKKVTYVTIAKALMENGSVKGVLATEFHTNVLMEEISKVKLFGDGYSFIIKTDGTTISHPNEKAINKNILDVGGSQFSKLLDNAKNEQKGQITLGFDGEERIYKFIRLQELDWIVVGTVSLKKINEKINSEVFSLILTGFAFLVIGTILVIILLNISLKPLISLKAHAIDLAEGEGDLTKQLEVKSEDEVGKASNEINNFIGKVQSTIDLAKTTSIENASIAHELSTTTLEVGKRVEDSTNIINDTTVLNITSANNLAFMLFCFITCLLKLLSYGDYLFLLYQTEMT
jgi:methyl-accepting chemotaxis protein